MTQPNVIFILTDQQRLSAVSCYGPTPCQTPHIDQLAASGTRFESVYTTFPVCSPARGTIMTGLYPHAHGISSNVGELGCSVHGLPDHPALLSRQLETAGYRCGYTGKWHLGEDAKSFFNVPHSSHLPHDVGFEGHNLPGHGDGGFGFEEYQTYLRMHGLTYNIERKDSATSGMRYGFFHGPVEATVPHFLADNSIDLLNHFQAGDQPFFIWHNFWGPHGPYYTPPQFYDQYLDISIPEWPNYQWDARHIPGPHHVKIHPQQDNRSWSDWAEAIRFYYGFASLIDVQIGRILAHLEALGLADNTIVIFASDHGETLGSHGGLVDKGWHHFEEIQRIPLIVRLPEGLGGQAGTKCDELISLADIFPTVLDFAGVELDPAAIHGRSIRPLLEDRPVKWRDYVVVEFFGLGNLSATMFTIRKGDLKYGWNASGQDVLFDLAQDPHETRNVIDLPLYRDALMELRAQLAYWMIETDYPGKKIYRHSRAIQNGF